MMKQRKQPSGRGAFLHESFRVTLFLKGLFSVFEIFGGVILIFMPPEKINRIVILLTQNELSEDPDDFFFTHLASWSQHLSLSSQMFAALYLLSHGVVKLSIVSSLWKGRLWAYPLGIAVFIVFIAYQLYRYQHTHAAGLIALTVFDVILILLTWTEYRRLRKGLAHI